ncbi:MAG TPA: tetratricopeptide repeat protein [Nitrospirota bacterium]|nr:tetratricopeptide repeat protein [Nitrospirota bacterium]
MRRLSFNTIFVCAAVLIVILSGCGLTKSRMKSDRDADAHHMLGIAYLNENNLQLAFMEFVKAVELNPNEKTYHYALGHVYFKMNKFNEAVKEYSNALTIDPEYGDAHNALGVVYGKMERWDDAISEYQKALNIPHYSSPQQARSNLGTAYFNKDDYQSAMIEFREAIKLQPEVAVFHLWLGHTYMNLDMTRDAIDAYGEVIKRDPMNVEAYYNLGLAHFKEDNKEGALAAFKKVVAISPNSSTAAEAMKYIQVLGKQ